MAIASLSFLLEIARDNDITAQGNDNHQDLQFINWSIDQPENVQLFSKTLVLLDYITEARQISAALQKLSGSFQNLCKNSQKLLRSFVDASQKLCRRFTKVLQRTYSSFSEALHKLPTSFAKASQKICRSFPEALQKLPRKFTAAS